MNEEDIKIRAQKTLRDELAAVRALNNLTGDKSLFKAAKLLSKRKGRIIVTGVGKSGFAGMKMASTFTSLGQPAVFIHPVEAFHGDSGAVGAGDVVIALSFSGGSAEVNRVVKYLKDAFSVSVIGITGNDSSILASSSDVVLKLVVKKEGCPLDLAPMASTTATMVIGDMLASAITSPEQFKPHHFAKFHPGGALGLSLASVEEVMTREEGIPLVVATASFHDALASITEKNFGVTGVINARRALVGIISDGDVRRFLLKNKNSIEKAKAKDAMTKNPKIIKAGATVKDALNIMEQNKITTLFVLDKNKKPVGILHMHSIVGGTFF